MRLALNGGRSPAGSESISVVRASANMANGMTLDQAGRLLVCEQGTRLERGVQVFTPCGDLIGEIRLPGAVNFAFGGPDGNILYVTADTAIWAAILGD